MRNFQGFSFCGTAYFLSLFCILFSLSHSLIPVFVSLVHPRFHLAGVILVQKKYPLIPGPGRLYISRSNTGHSLYKSVAPFTPVGEVPPIWISSPPCTTDPGTVTRSSMHSCPQGLLSHSYTAQSTSEKAAVPLSHQDCLSLSWKHRRTLAQRAAAVWVLLVVG